MTWDSTLLARMAIEPIEVEKQEEKDDQPNISTPPPLLASVFRKGLPN